MPTRPLSLGKKRPLDRLPGLGAAREAPTAFELPAHHLVTHGVVMGMTGSGKTGLLMVLAEEALRSRVPVLLVDVKGDLPNLLLAFPGLDAASFLPWIDAEGAARRGATPEAAAEETARAWREGLASSGLGPDDVRAFVDGVSPRIITPGAAIAEPLHVLSSLETRSALWDVDEDAAHDALSASVSLVLRLAGQDGDPRSRAHVVLSTFAERRFRAGQGASLAALLSDLQNPPTPTIGALAFEEFLPPKEQKALAQDLNTLLASPRLSSWLKGAPLDVTGWLTPKEGKTPLVIVSVAHLDDEERQLVLGLLLEEIVAHVRGLSGTTELRSLVIFDEVFGFLPPHPANPPTKRPLLGLLKQARAFGVGVVLATQNPMDLDYKALSNAGAWFIGRLSTDADRERVVEGLAGADGGVGLDKEELATVIKGLPKRTFFARDLHADEPTALLETRWSMSWMRGPLTRREITRLVKGRAGATTTTTATATPTTTATATATATPTTTATPTKAGSAAAAAGPPPAPDGFRVLHGYAPTEARAVRYTPFLAASVAFAVRDPKLGVAVDRVMTFVAPLEVDGRADVTRITSVDPARLDTPAHRAATYEPLPRALATKKALQAAQRAMRDAAWSSLSIDVDANRELGLARHDGETREAFAARCTAEAERRAVEEAHLVTAKRSPELARLADKRASAERQVAEARAQWGQAPSEVGAVVMGIFGGQRAAGRIDKERQRAQTALARAEEAWRKVEVALSAAVAEQQAALGSLRAQWLRAAGAIQTERLTPKKGDVDVVGMAIAWSAGKIDPT